MGVNGNKSIGGLLLDLFCVAGVLIFCFGLGMAWRPLGVMALGAAVAGAGFLMGYESRLGNG